LLKSKSRTGPDVESIFLYTSTKQAKL